MAVSALTGPFVVYGRDPSAAGFTSDSNPDLGPSAFSVGWGIIDPRFGWRRDVPPGSAGAFVFYGSDILVIDQVPSTLEANNISAAANAVSGTAQALVSSTGAGITVMASAFTIPQTGIVIPKGSLAIDGLPAIISYGQNGTIGAPDPRTTIARAITVTGVSAGAGGAFTIKGADLYGNPQTATLTATAGATSVTTTKTFKFIYSITPGFSDAHNYEFGTADVYGFPLRVDEFAGARIVWAGVAGLTAGVTAADTTTPGLTTGDVRGTYASPSASNGTNKLTVYVAVTPWNASTTVGLLGNTPA